MPNKEFPALKLSTGKCTLYTWLKVGSSGGC
jgi:hypothetical protein